MSRPTKRTLGAAIFAVGCLMCLAGSRAVLPVGATARERTERTVGLLVDMAVLVGGAGLWARNRA